jgi:hypothetical protein
MPGLGEQTHDPTEVYGPRTKARDWHPGLTSRRNLAGFVEDDVALGDFGAAGLEALAEAGQSETSGRKRSCLVFDVTERREVGFDFLFFVGC